MNNTVIDNIMNFIRMFFNSLFNINNILIVLIVIIAAIIIGVFFRKKK